MAIEVFNRYENKYMLDENTCNKIESRISEYMELDGYNKQNETYTITNLYYDTEDNRMIRGSLAKPKYKEKLRLWAYGVPGHMGGQRGGLCAETSLDINDKVYIEI